MGPAADRADAGARNSWFSCLQSSWPPILTATTDTPARELCPSEATGGENPDLRRQTIASERPGSKKQVPHGTDSRWQSQPKTGAEAQPPAEHVGMPWYRKIPPSGFGKSRASVAIKSGSSTSNRGPRPIFAAVELRLSLTIDYGSVKGSL